MALNYTVTAHGRPAARHEGRAPSVGTVIASGDIAKTNADSGLLFGLLPQKEGRSYSLPDGTIYRETTIKDKEGNDMVVWANTRDKGDWFQMEANEEKKADTGGGGIPVVANEDGDLRGIAAVIDKDLASALLASQVDADLLLISTAVEQVALNFGKPNQEWVSRLTLAEVKRYLEDGGHFAEGSMAPKMQAVVQFLEDGGKEALITNPENLERAMAGETGTRIVP